VTCARCGRGIWGARALASGYGEQCRRRVLRAARALHQGGGSVQRHAATLLEEGVTVPHGHPRVWLVPSSDGDRWYLAHPNACTCDGGRYQCVCYHRVAAQVLAA
jgi:hypothetical protein